KALTTSEEVSFCNYNPPHPYMMEPMPSKHQGKISGQTMPSQKYLQTVDIRKAEWPDIPKQVETGAADTPAQTTTIATTGTAAAPIAGPGTYPQEKKDDKKKRPDLAKTTYFPR